MEIIGPKFVEILTSVSKDAVKEILKEDSALLIHDKNEELKGIITKSDLL